MNTLGHILSDEQYEEYVSLLKMKKTANFALVRAEFDEEMEQFFTQDYAMVSVDTISDSEMMVDIRNIVSDEVTKVEKAKKNMLDKITQERESFEKDIVKFQQERLKALVERNKALQAPTIWEFLKRRNGLKREL
ncbi:MAG: hypothetical protein JXR54_09825 [Tannerellaceae bacterium]|nr:hypothetical protein [Tannerellaceae bacterium]